MANDGTIGPSGSGATARADDDTEALYALLWTNIADGFAPVTGGRGASAAADWAAAKPLALTRMLGRALGIAGSGASLTGRDLGQYLGAETHVLASGEMPSHSHTGSTAAAGSHAHGGSTNTTGSHVHNANIRHDFTASSGGDGLNWPASAGTLTSAAMQAAGDHAHTITTDTAAAHAHTVTINNTGGGGAHNNLQPTAFLNAMVKL
jgi:microcystin-dependent protein